MSRRRIVVLAGAAGALAAAAIVGLATMGQAGPGPKAEDSSEPVVHKVTENPKDVEAYWTEERMRDAQPAPMPKASEEPPQTP